MVDGPDMSRRDVLRIGSVSAGLVVGILQSDEPVEDFVPAVGDTGYAARITNQFLVGSDYETIRDTVERYPSIGFAETGNWYVFGDEKDSFSIDDFDFLVNVDGYEEAKDLVTSTPTLAFTSVGNKWVFA